MREKYIIRTKAVFDREFKFLLLSILQKKCGFVLQKLDFHRKRVSSLLRFWDLGKPTLLEIRISGTYSDIKEFSHFFVSGGTPCTIFFFIVLEESQ